MKRTQGWAQRKDRHPVEIQAEVQRADGRREPVKLSNFSDEGCCMDARGDFHIGERLRIAIPRMGHIKAQVRWSTPGMVGARFVAESDF